MNLHDAGGLDPGPEDVLLGGLILLGAKPVQVVEEAERGGELNSGGRKKPGQEDVTNVVAGLGAVLNVERKAGSAFIKHDSPPDRRWKNKKRKMLSCC